MKGKFYSTQNGGNRSFLGSKSTFLNISQNLFIRLFWNCTSRQALKSGQTRLLDFEGKLILYSNGLEDQVLEPGVVVVLDYFYFLFCESEQYFLFSTLLEIARHTVKLRRLVSEVLLWNWSNHVPYWESLDIILGSIINIISWNIQRWETLLILVLNPLQPIVAFLYPLKISENF